MSENFIVTVLGRKGSGKTTLAMAMLKEHNRVVALDTMGQYSPRSRDDLCVTFNAAIAALARTDARKKFVISVRLDDVEDYADILDLCYHVPRSLIVIEEASLFCSPFNLPTCLSRLIRYGRHREISLLFIARRPSELHRDVTAQSDAVVTFAQSEPRDLQYLSAYAGRDVTREVRSLPLYRCAAYMPVAVSRSKLPLAVRASLARGSLVQPKLALGAETADEKVIDAEEGDA